MSGCSLRWTGHRRRPWAALARAEVQGEAKMARRAQRVVERCRLERALYVLARHTGRRVSAMVGLQWGDWLPDETLYGALRWRAANDKLGRSWTVPVTAAVREAIEAPPRRDAWVSLHPHHPERPVTREMASNWLRATGERAGLEHVTGGGWHMFRRLWATERKDLSLKDVAYAGGWKVTTTLVNVHQQLDAEALQRVVEGGRRNIRAV